MVWLHRSLIPVGRRGDNFLVQMISTCLAPRRGRGVGSVPVSYTLYICERINLGDLLVFSFATREGLKGAGGIG
jgi:hypothetical protein